MTRLILLAGLSLLAMAGFGEAPSTPLRLAGMPEADFSARFESLVWRIDGSLEIQGKDAHDQAVSVTIWGLALNGFPAVRIATFSGESHDSPEGPSRILRFADARGKSIGVLASGFYARYAIVGPYSLSAGKPLAGVARGAASEIPCSIRLTADKLSSPVATPGQSLRLMIDGQEWTFMLSQANSRNVVAKGTAVEGPAFSADFYAFVKP